MPMNASILAVGTELTTGQIINRNAATISQNLKQYGVQTRCHLTIADDKIIIVESLQALEVHSDLLFITGGLGPTSDDFTRDVIAEWADRPLQFNEAAWQHVSERLNARGQKVREMQRQQCFFPEGAKILTNADGTAHGFQLTLERPTGHKNIFVLPGPPREIERIWSDHVQPWLVENTKSLDKIITKAWDTLGLGESEIAHLVESALTNRPPSPFLEIGYRAHLPYVEVKLSYFESEKSIWQDWSEKVDAALRAHTITRDFADVAQLVAAGLKSVDFTFYDYVSDGYLHGRMSPHLRALKKWSFKQSYGTDVTADFFDDEDQFLALFPYGDDQCVVLFSVNGHRVMKTVEAPMKAPALAERRKQYFAEMGLVELTRILKVKSNIDRKKNEL